MGIIELLENIGEDNCMVQSVHQNLIKFKTVKNQAELTFVTSIDNAPNLVGVCDNVGLVVWVNKEIYDAAFKKAQEK